MAKAIAAELKEVETKRGKKAKVEPAGDEVDVPEGV
jgi:hypothetical protein